MAGGKLCVNMEIVGAQYNLSYLGVMFNASHGGKHKKYPPCQL